jgi:hypothetical protein
MDPGGLFLSRGRQPDDERAAVVGAVLTADERGLFKTIEHAGEGGALVREGAVDIYQRRISGLIQMTEDVGLGLSESGGVALDIEADLMRGAVDAENQFEAHMAPA